MSEDTIQAEIEGIGKQIEKLEARLVATATTLELVHRLRNQLGSVEAKVAAVEAQAEKLKQ